ncbi:MAG: putative Ig domain-containing protein, partial [Proteobacteria bacterium]|nr:putative Ig domain-containing protein [Pseudomonadota bacterium]
MATETLEERYDEFVDIFSNIFIGVQVSVEGLARIVDEHIKINPNDTKAIEFADGLRLFGRVFNPAATIATITLEEYGEIEDNPEIGINAFFAKVGFISGLSLAGARLGQLGGIALATGGLALVGASPAVIAVGTAVAGIVGAIGLGIAFAEVARFILDELEANGIFSGDEVQIADLGDSIEFIGTNSDDSIIGTTGEDRIYGNIGADTLSGGDGEDIIYGGEGAGSSPDDFINGGSGNDQLFGDDIDLGSQGGRDTLFGGAGLDVLYGGGGSDVLYGDDDTEEDVLVGGQGSDKFFAGDSDIIDDPDRLDTVYLDGILLKGGEASLGKNVSDDEQVWIGDKYGERYTKEGGDLKVTYNGSTLIIKDWNKRDSHANINLRPKDDPVPDRYSSPLVLDLDGDGIELIALDDSAAFFDIDEDEGRERTAWVSADDGILALDRNGDGVINDAGELFGYGETYSYGSINGGSGSNLQGPGEIDIRFESGFDKLAELDLNLDGVIDGSDVAYSELRVWRDLNEDGISEGNELFTLAEVGVASISLSSTAVSETIADSLVTDTAIYTTTEGVDRAISDIWFRFDQYDVRFDEPENLDPTLAALPELGGAGAVKDLHVAMAEDPGLRTLVEQVTNLGIADLSKLSPLVDEILWRWTGVSENTTAFSRGPYADGRAVEVIEAFSDTPFAQWSGPNPRPTAGSVLMEQYDVIHRNVAAQLAAQATFGQTLFPEITYEQNQFLVLADGTNSTDLLQRLVDNAPSDWSAKIAHFHAGLRLLDTIYKSFADVKAAADDGAGYLAAVETLLQSEGLDLTYFEIITAHLGGEGNDSLITQSNAGNQYPAHSQIVSTGSGNDEVSFGGGKSILYWGQGQGNDAVSFSPFGYFGWDILPRVEIRLPDLLQADVAIEAGDGWSQDIVITIVATGETLTIRNYLIQDRSESSVMVFSDGTTLSFEDVIAGPSETGTVDDDRLLQVTGGTLDGGAGDDLLLGGEQATTFVFGLGYGHDEIRDIADKNVVNTVVFGPGIAAADLIFGREGPVGQHLTIQISGTNDVLTIADQFGQILPGPSEPAIDRFMFDDGSEITSDYIRNLQMENGDGNDVVQGEYGIDIFDSYGDDGNDTLHGYQGADLYYFNSGNGQDRIEDKGSDLNEDRVVFSFAMDTYTITRAGEVITFLNSGNGDQLIVDNTKGKVEIYEFNDQTWLYDDLLVFIDLSGSDGTEVLGSSDADLLVGTADDENFVALSGNDTVEGNGGIDVIKGGAGSDSLDGGTENDFLFGENDSDELVGGEGDDELYGGSGSDTLFGGIGNDLLVDGDDSFENNEFYGGLGDDTLVGEYAFSSFDTFHYNLGDGNDLIVDNGIFNSVDTLVFGPGITESDLDFSFVRIDLSQHKGPFQGKSEQWGLQVEVANDALLTLAGHPFHEVGGVETIRFDDGSELSMASVLASMRTQDATDQLIVGTGTSGNAVLSGGAGNDTLGGTQGAPNFYFELGGGQDVILPDSTNSTVGLITFGPGLNYADLTISRSGDLDENLVLSFTGGDSVTVLNQYSSYVDGFGEYQRVNYIQSIVFDDGTTVDAAAIYAATMPITAGDDSMIGSAFEETFAVSGGNDTMIGAGDGDTYEFGIGAGSDVIIETAQSHEFSPFVSEGEFSVEADLSLVRETDTVTFGAGITINDLVLTIVGDSQQDLQIQITGTTDYLLIKDQFSPAGNWGAIAENSGFGEFLEGEVSKDYWDLKFAAEFGSAPLFAAGIEKFVFADGSEFTREEFATYIGGRENDGDNTIQSDDQGGTLDGGAGEDRLEGGSGDDVYKFDTGYFNDVAADAGGNDKVEFGVGIVPEAVAFTRTGENGDDLLIEIGGVERNSLLIEGQFANDGRKIEEFQLSDGSLWSAADIENYLLFQSITSGSDTIVGYEGDDVINARAGDDIIDVRGGDDSIDGGAGRDTVIFQGPQANFDIRVEGNETIVEDIVGAQGLKRLVNVEELEFVSDDGSSVFVEQVANMSPSAGVANFAGREDTTLILFASEILSNASDPDGDGLAITEVSNAQNGIVALDSNGRVTFTPDANYYGTASFEYTVTDAGGLTSTGTASIQIESVNDAPIVANAVLDQEGTEDQLFSYVVPADVFSDLDTTDLTLSATMNDGSALPAWLAFDGPNRTFSGTPPQNFNGVLFVSFAANDGEASIATDFAITINAVNDAPVAVTPLTDVVAVVGDNLDIVLPQDAFVDVDEEALFYTATLSDGSTLPAWLTIDPLTGNFSGVPGQIDDGSYSIDVTASDGLETVTSSFALTIDSDNTAPTVDQGLTNQSTAEDAAFSFAIPADAFADADAGDVLSYSATLDDGSALPAWLSLNNGTLSGTPENSDVGTLIIKVTATDGSGASVDSNFTIDVTNTNDAPVVSVGLADQTATEDALFSYAVPVDAFSDIDVGDILSYSAALVGGGALPTWLTFDGTSFSGTPTGTDAGVLAVEVTATDTSSASVSTVFDLDVGALNQSPTTDGGTIELPVNGTTTGVLQASDAETPSSSLTYSLQSAASN